MHVKRSHRVCIESTGVGLLSIPTLIQWAHPVPTAKYLCLGTVQGAKGIFSSKVNSFLFISSKEQRGSTRLEIVSYNPCPSPESAPRASAPTSHCTQGLPPPNPLDFSSLSHLHKAIVVVLKVMKSFHQGTQKCLLGMERPNIY